MKKFIKPIKKIEDLILWKNKVKEIAPLPVFAFFVVALDTGVSPQFLLNLKWSDLKRDEIVSEIQVSEPYFEVYCELAGETRQIRFGNESLEILNELRKNYPDDIYIFQTHAANVPGKQQPVNMYSIGNIFKEAARQAKISGADEVSAVTLRKTFGYHHVVTGSWSIYQLTRYFDHKYSGITKKYIDLTSEEVNTKQLPRKRRCNSTVKK